MPGLLGSVISVNGSALPHSSRTVSACPSDHWLSAAALDVARFGRCRDAVTATG